MTERHKTFSPGGSLPHGAMAFSMSTSLVGCYADDSDLEGSSEEVWTARSRTDAGLGVWRTANAPRPRPRSQPKVEVPPIKCFPGDRAPIKWQQKSKSVPPPRKGSFAGRQKIVPRLRATRRPSDKKVESQASSKPAFEQLVNFMQSFGAAAPEPPAAGASEQHDSPGSEQASVLQAAQLGCFQPPVAVPHFQPPVPVPQDPGRGTESTDQNYIGISEGVVAEDMKWRTCNISNLCEDDDEIRLVSRDRKSVV